MHVDTETFKVLIVYFPAQYWRDYRLSWNTDVYGGIEDLVVDSTRIWLPDVTLYNK